ncbi:guanine nucleotide-binding protein G(s) subunit alpha isoforms XLas-like [Thomomys bottae]
MGMRHRLNGSNMSGQHDIPGEDGEQPEQEPVEAPGAAAPGAGPGPAEEMDAEPPPTEPVSIEINGEASGPPDVPGAHDQGLSPTFEEAGVFGDYSPPPEEAMPFEVEQPTVGGFWPSLEKSGSPGAGAGLQAFSPAPMEPGALGEAEAGLGGYSPPPEEAMPFEFDQPVPESSGQPLLQAPDLAPGGPGVPGGPPAEPRVMGRASAAFAAFGGSYSPPPEEAMPFGLDGEAFENDSPPPGLPRIIRQADSGGHFPAVAVPEALCLAAAANAPPLRVWGAIGSPTREAVRAPLVHACASPPIERAGPPIQIGSAPTGVDDAPVNMDNPPIAEDGPPIAIWGAPDKSERAQGPPVEGEAAEMEGREASAAAAEEGDVPDPGDGPSASPGGATADPEVGPAAAAAAEPDAGGAPAEPEAQEAGGAPAAAEAAAAAEPGAQEARGAPVARADAGARGGPASPADAGKWATPSTRAHPGAQGAPAARADPEGAGAVPAAAKAAKAAEPAAPRVPLISTTNPVVRGTRIAPAAAVILGPSPSPALRAARASAAIRAISTKADTAGRPGCSSGPPLGLIRTAFVGPVAGPPRQLQFLRPPSPEIQVADPPTPRPTRSSSSASRGSKGDRGRIRIRYQEQYPSDSSSEESEHKSLGCFHWWPRRSQSSRKSASTTERNFLRNFLVHSFGTCFCGCDNPDHTSGSPSGPRSESVEERLHQIRKEALEMRSQRRPELQRCRRLEQLQEEKTDYMCTHRLLLLGRKVVPGYTEGRYRLEASGSTSRRKQDRRGLQGGKTLVWARSSVPVRGRPAARRAKPRRERWRGILGNGLGGWRRFLTSHSFAKPSRLFR